MKLEKVLQSLKDLLDKKYIKFVAEQGPNCCEACLKYNNQIYSIDDSDKPELPIHPNCRCKYIEVGADEIKEIKERILSIADELRSYAQKIAERRKSLSAEAKTILQQAKNCENKTLTSFLKEKTSAIIADIQQILFCQDEVQLTIDVLREYAQHVNVNIDSFYSGAKYFLTATSELSSILKELHYMRLNEDDQRLKNLPANEREALKRGFKRAPDDQNRYHRNKGQTENEKYYHPITGQEVVFGKDGKIVTIPENIGTKNYGPEPVSLEHFVKDVVPYWIWGNSAEDTTPLLDRILGL